MAARRRKGCRVRLAPAATRQLRKLPAEPRRRISDALEALARRLETGSREGKGVKALRGRSERFYRLRVGDYRVMYDRLEEERILLVLGIVHRRDLERWLRGK